MNKKRDIDSLYSDDAKAFDFSWAKCPVGIVKVPFADDYCQKILDSKVNQDLKKQVETLLMQGMNDMDKTRFQKSIEKGFPGSLASVIQRKQFDEIRSNNYNILPKTDGTRCMLILMKLNSKLMCIVANRSNQYHIITIQGFTIPAFDGTYLDGELVKETNGEYVFQVFDCLLTKGKNVINEKHRTRLQEAKDVCSGLLNNPILQNANPFKIEIKSYIERAEMLAWKKAFQSLGVSNVKKEYAVDGFIFINEDNPYIFGRDPTLVKWKFEHTVDFICRVAKDKSSYSFGVQNGHHKTQIIQTGKFDSEFFQEFEDDISLFLEKSRNFEVLDGCIMECRWNGKWKPVKRRQDKYFPNSLNTYELVMLNVKEAISFADIYDLF